MGKKNIIFLFSSLTVLAVQGGEITPINAIASSLASNDNISNIIDKGPDSLACTGQEKHPWVQVNLEKVYCIAMVQVKRLYGICNFTVSENNSTIESTEDCGRLQLKVFNRSAAPQNQLTTYQSQPKLGCLLGDSVKVARNMLGSICVKELTITELKDCDVSSLTWNHASTNKDMPVHHGTRMTVNCETGFINSGGSKVYCHDGELLPVNEPPNCGLTKNVRPIAVNQSSCPSETYSAEHAIDGDASTQSCTTSEEGATSWLLAKFGEEFCFSQVIILRSGYNCTFSFNCGKAVAHPEDRCAKLLLQIQNVSNVMPGCVFGHSFLLQMTMRNIQLCVREIVFRISNPEGMMKCCVMEPKWPNLKISSHLPARHGDILTVSCKPGYSLSVGSNSNVTCFDGTIQTEEQEKLPICLADCANNGFAKDGVVTEPSLPVQHGTQITFHCRPGYSSYGSETGICNNGTIAQTDGFPKCYADCKQEHNDMEIDNVMTEPHLPVPHGTRMTYYCRPGYSNFGGKTGFCNNGTVSPKDSSPQCYGNNSSTSHD